MYTALRLVTLLLDGLRLVAKGSPESGLALVRPSL